MIGYEQFVKEEQPRLRAEGKHVGIAVHTLYRDNRRRPL